MWTKTVPTKPGFYWAKQNSEATGTIIRFNGALWYTGGNRDGVPSNRITSHYRLFYSLPIIPPNDNKLLTRDEAAAYLGIRPHTLATWVTRKAPELPFIKVGRLARYRREDLDKFLQSNTIINEK